MINEILIVGIPIVLVVVALSQTFKSMGVSKRLIPLINIVEGIILTSLLQGKIDVNSILVGLVVGLSAGGAFSGTKATVGK